MTVATRFTLALLTATSVVLAQTPNGGWRRVGDPPPATAAPAPAPAPSTDNQDPSEPVDRSPIGTPDAAQQPEAQVAQQPELQPETQPEAEPAPAGAMAPGQAPYPQGAPTHNAPPPYGLPAHVTLKAGTFVTVRMNQALSSDHNNRGDSFSATLMQPVVVDGIVVAQRGQTVYGRVEEAQKATVNNPSRLGFQLTSLTLADGTQVPIHTQMVVPKGPTTPAGVQAGTVAGTTAVGAGIGAAVGWGTGAAIGAGAGAIAGIAGVLLTRHHATVVAPETPLTFNVLAATTIATDNPQAFRYASPEDFQQQGYRAQMGPRPAGPAPGPGYAYGSGYAYGPGYAAPYPYPYAYYPYPYAYWGPYWGPGFGVVVGGRGYYGYGYGRRWR